MSMDDLSIDTSASSSIEAVEDSLDPHYRRTAHRPAPQLHRGATSTPPALMHYGQRQQRAAVQNSQWQAPELQRARLLDASSPLVGPSGTGFLADPFDSGSPARPPHFHHHSAAMSPAMAMSRTPSSTLADAVTPVNVTAAPHYERQYRAMPPPPPAPTRPTRPVASEATQHHGNQQSQQQAHAPSLWRGAPVRSRVSDAFASPPSSSFSAELGMPMPSFLLPPQPNVNLDTAALAAERRNRDARSVTQPAQPLFRQQQMQSQEQQTLHHTGQQRREQLLRTPETAAELGTGAPSRRLMSFAPQGFSTGQAPAFGGDVSDSQASFSSLPPLPTVTVQGNVHDHSTGSYATMEDTTSASNSELPPAEPNTAQFQKWDGSAMTVPTWLVSATAAEEEVEEWFEADAVTRFDVKALVARSQSVAVGTIADSREVEKVEEDVAQQDVLKAILETQLGLRTGLGWYGYTYRNPKVTPRTRQTSDNLDIVDGTHGSVERVSRKRRRISSSPSPVATSSGIAQTTEQPASADTSSSHDETGNASDEETVELIYDAFGRVRGTVPKMGYEERGGPRAPLPPPLETASIRAECARGMVLDSYHQKSRRESRLLAEIHLVHEQYKQLHARDSKSAPTTIKSRALYDQLKARQTALARFRSKTRADSLKALQNAVLSSSTPFHSITSNALWRD